MKFQIRRIWKKQTSIIVDMWNDDNKLNIEIELHDSSKPFKLMTQYHQFIHALTAKMNNDEKVTANEVIETFNTYKHTINITDRYVQNIISYER